MTDSQKNSLLVVVVFITSLSTIPSTLAFTQELQEYTSEISRRSFSLGEFFRSDSMLMKLGEPLFKTVTFVVALFQFSRMMTEYFPMLRDLMELVGIGSIGGIPLLGQMPTQMTTARDGQNREQRLINHLDHQVHAAVAHGQLEYENELKKKK